MPIKNKINGFTIIELIVVSATIGILVAIIVPASNFSYIAASIIARSQLTSEPLKKEIEKYYFENKKFPDNELRAVFINAKKSDRVKAMILLSDGRIMITYDSSDIKWGSTWWFNWYNPLSNDLTDRDLILVPSVKGNKIVWDECNFGTVPKRNRHYKCSQHK